MVNLKGVAMLTWFKEIDARVEWNGRRGGWRTRGIRQGNSIRSVGRPNFVVEASLELIRVKKNQ